MRVNVRLFAQLRDIAGASILSRQLPAGSSAGALWNILASECPELKCYRRTISTAVNEEYANMDRELAEGDEVAFLPPVSGG